MRPESTYPRCETWHESVPAIGLTLFDHFQPGSKVALPTTRPPMLTTSALPIPSNGRVSSGESKFLISACATSAPLSWIGGEIRPYPNVSPRGRTLPSRKKAPTPRSRPGCGSKPHFCFARKAEVKLVECCFHAEGEARRVSGAPRLSNSQSAWENGHRGDVLNECHRWIGMSDALDSRQVGDASRRTRLASERTQLAWWRTGLTALAVGLAIGRVLPELAADVEQ